jgi:hypothetical protein
LPAAGTRATLAMEVAAFPSETAASATPADPFFSLGRK